MSKAFLRESDFDSLPDLPPPTSLLPSGVKNLITAAGARQLRSELERLIEVERPSLAGSAGADIDAKRELQTLDHRIRYLQESLRNAEIIGPAEEDLDVVRFGATVSVLTAQGGEDTYRIVGVDETDLERSWVSWRSPIAQALLNHHVGEQVSFRSPAGPKALRITRVHYDDAE